MSAEQLKHLFSPIKIGPFTLPNRICFSAHVTLLANEDYLPHERQIYYYAERAKGGASLIVVGGSHAHPTSSWMPGHNLVSDERSIPGYKKMTAACHEHGAIILSQLYHYGREMISAWSRLPLWAPSPLPTSLERETPKEMEKEDIKEMMEYTAKSARNALEGGFDGVEILCAQGLLTNQFLSPHTNKRTDEYGGDLDHRMRYLLEIIDCCRDAVGKDHVVGLKLNGDDFIAGGLTLADTQKVAARVAETGKLDYIHVCAGTIDYIAAIVPDMSFPLGCMVHLASGIKEFVKIPVMANKRIVDPVQAEQILANGQADFIAMARALICDPEWPIKARQGRFDEIRTCVGCTEGCIGRVIKNTRVSCIQNPAVGEEKKWGMGTLSPAKQKKKVMVIGGGPAGLKAAETAALRGHEVVLYEKEPQLGGQVNIAIKVPGRDELGGVTRHLSQQINRLGVKVVLGQEATVGTVKKENPDAVVVATGSAPLRSGYCSAKPDLERIPGVEQKNVLTIWEVLKGEKPVGQKVVMIDQDGDMQATSTVEFLASQGKHVEIVTHMPFVGMDVSLCAFDPQYERLHKFDVTIHPFSLVKEIKGNTVTISNLYNPDKERKIEGVDTVVLAMGNRASNDLYRALKGQVKELYAVGDCVAPRKIIEAVYEGHKVGRSL